MSEVLVHVAAMPDREGEQRCSRCGLVLHRPNAGAPPPWYPGQLVAASPQARWAARSEPFPACEPPA